jgi:membrane protein implicated in regulation of membrane protease activity
MQPFVVVLWFALAAYAVLRGDTLGQTVGVVAILMGVLRLTRWWAASRKYDREPRRPAQRPSGEYHPEFDFSDRE